MLPLTPALYADTFGGCGWRSLSERARPALSGEILWTAGGAEIFSEGLTVTKTEVRVEDFNHDRYIFDVETGSAISRTQ